LNKELVVPITMTRQLHVRTYVSTKKCLIHRD